MQAVSQPMPDSVWAYRARVVRVIDGDSLVCVIDVGFGLQHHGIEGVHIRLLGIDTPERGKPGFSTATEFVEAWVARAESGVPTWPLVIRTRKPDNFGRYLADIWSVWDGSHLNSDLLNAGLAVPYTR